MSRKLPISKYQRIFWMAALSCVVFLVCLSWPKYLYLQSDIFWLIETGRYILDNKHLPAQDIFSYTRAGEPWTLYQWFFEAWLAALFALGGWLPIALFAIGLLAFLFFVGIYRDLLNDGADPLICLFVIVLGLFATMPDVVAVRPQIISFLLLWLVQRTLHKLKSYDKSSKKGLWLLIPIIVLWANTHLSFVIQLVVMAIYLLSFLAGRRRLPWKPLGLVLSICSVSSLLNPYGFGLYEFLARSWQQNVITPELRPLEWWHNPVLVIYICAAVAAYGYSAHRLRREYSPFVLANLLTAAVFLCAGLAGARFILYFVIWTLPLTSQLLSQLMSSQSARWEPVKEAMVSVITSRVYPVVIAAIALMVALVEPVYFPDAVPVGAGEYLSHHRPSGHLFCSENAGSYLIYRFRGQIPVFVDTRVDLYGRSFIDLYKQAMLYGNGWQDLMSRWKVRLALVPNRYILAARLHDAGWKLVYHDPDYSIFQKP